MIRNILFNRLWKQLAHAIKEANTMFELDSSFLSQDESLLSQDYLTKTESEVKSIVEEYNSHFKDEEEFYFEAEYITNNNNKYIIGFYFEDDNFVVNKEFIEYIESM